MSGIGGDIRPGHNLARPSIIVLRLTRLNKRELPVGCRIVDAQNTMSVRQGCGSGSLYIAGDGLDHQQKPRLHTGGSGNTSEGRTRYSSSTDNPQETYESAPHKAHSRYSGLSRAVR